MNMQIISELHPQTQLQSAIVKYKCYINIMRKGMNIGSLEQSA